MSYKIWTATDGMEKENRRAWKEFRRMGKGLKRTRETSWWIKEKVEKNGTANKNDKKDELRRNDKNSNVKQMNIFQQYI